MSLVSAMWVPQAVLWHLYDTDVCNKAERDQSQPPPKSCFPKPERIEFQEKVMV